VSISGYNGGVARGWESKSVEEQISERQADLEFADKQMQADRRETEQRIRRESIRLARSHTLTALESTHDERYRALLEATLAHLDSELAKLDQ
jgi:hypothetical protein